MKINDIPQLITEINAGALKEHSFENVELKRDWAKEHGEKISMLCNGNPNNKNFLVIGLEDDGTLSRHDESWLKSRLETFSNHLNQFLDPVITQLEITSVKVSTSQLIIAVFKNPGVVVKWQGNAWIGLGTTKKKLNSAEILELSLSLPGLTDFTKRSSSFAASADLVADFCDAGGVINDVDILSKHHLDNTKCGEILFGDISYRIIYHAENDQIMKNETRKGLFGLLTPAFVTEVNNYYSEKMVSSSFTLESILREALGNCVGHAAYHENNGEVIVELFPNGLHISNLAYDEYISLANKWFSSAHKSPNPFLMETLRLVGKVDELGKGKQRLLKECLINGFDVPLITISDAGRFRRWKLVIEFGNKNDNYKKVLAQLQEVYPNEKALIAYALVLWRDKPFSEIAKYFDTHGAKVASEILTDVYGPLFYYQEKDKIILHRWAQILLDKGKSSEDFSPHELQQLLAHCKNMSIKFHDGYITPAQFRGYAHLSESASDKTLTSKIFKKWMKDNLIKKEARGVYRFIAKSDTVKTADFAFILEAFAKGLKGEAG